MTIRGDKLPKNLEDWRVKRVLDALAHEFAAHRKDMPPQLAENIESYWPAFTQQIRASRNEAGHPVSVNPVTPESVHAGLLIFPELAKLGNAVIEWIRNHYV